MDALQNLISLLIEALHNPTGRDKAIKKFQLEIWQNAEPLTEDWIWEIFSDLAYDLDYYESDPAVRKEDPSYYGNERLEEEIKSALTKIKQGGISISI